MSINSALLSGVSGLLANSSALAVISDNISNANTVGYKRNQAEFQTLVTARTYGSSTGGRGGYYNAGGVLAQTRQRISEQGQLQQTSSGTDLALRGGGFFVTTEKPEGLLDSDARLFTRAGSFTLDELGYLQNSAGLYLQGWPADVDGNISYDPSDLGRLQTINVARVGTAVGETTRIGVSGNLNAATPANPATTIVPPAVAAVYNPNTVAGSMAGGGVEPDFEFQLPVYDSKGGKRTIAIGLLRTANPNEWQAEIYAVPRDSVEVAGGAVPGQIGRGVVAFNSSGQLDTANSTLFDSDPGTAGVQYDASLNFLPSNHTAALTGTEFKWATSLGVDAQTLQLDLDDPTAGLTQVSDRSYIRAVTNDGVAVGSLTKVEVDNEGYVTAIFDNGVTRRVAQVAIATFPNPDALSPLSGNAYLPSNDSGTFSLNPAGTGGAGFIAAAALESSTVDLSTEFTGLITTQRAYSASSKIITTADEMLEELIRIKR